MTHIKLFFVALIAFLILDGLWLGFIAKGMYLAEYKNWLRLEGGELVPLYWSAAVVYFLLALAVVVFVIPLAQGSMAWACFYGAILGLITYGVYDFTCLAIFANWPLRITVIDWAWGTFICSMSSVITLWVHTRIF